MNEDLLRRIPLFEGLAPDELRRLAGYLREEHYVAHRPVFWMNEAGNHLYLIVEGEVQISYTSDEGGEVPLARLGAGDFFGELSLIDGAPHSANARTRSEVRMLRLDRDSFYRFLEQHPHSALTLLRVLSARLRNSTAQQRGVANPSEQIGARPPRFQRAIDALARVFTGSAFLLLYPLFIAGWIVAQSIEWRRLHGGPVHYTDQPPTFFFLGFIVTLFSSLLTVFILNSQRRQAQADRIRSEIEYQVNLKAQAEVVKLQAKMDEVLERLGRDS
ncbi:cyclic nucleotide-binding domain-containing protein [Flaviaesturariibacter aridisoli]|uniref:Cyclic nucleotide-binding domain-containing protein n=1 Tax=Flaviaesturariibacter aridisoli TaxID=2545761 RepID=A0A4V2WM85_9BACT|nr:cyclic nucleotide-binding domain-containing protein [Flaviaesturariibacter aridisoli]TCZ67061.1 cyclic nucleotide-binding domain-containing protein [Flaviaesturariibacter aridisoli]